MAAVTIPRLAAGVGSALVGGATVGVVVAVVTRIAPAVAVAAPLVVLAVAASVRSPRAALLGSILLVVLLEGDPQSFLGSTEAFYVPLPLIRLRASDLLVLYLLAVVVLAAWRRREPLRAPGLMTMPLVALAAAGALGVVVGITGGGDAFVIAYAFLALVTLILTPFCAVNALSPGDLVPSAGLVVGLAGVKGIEGLVGWLTAQGRQVGDTTLTFYGPMTNFLFVLVILGLLSVRLAGRRLPVAAYAAGGLAALALLLSFRRSFWIAAVLGAVLCALVGSGRRRRPLVIPAVAALALAVAWMINGGGATQSTNVVVERVQAVRPSRALASIEDRYRLEEQRNVVAEVRAAPITGLGLGVPWQARYPLSQQHVGGRDYVHLALLWFWLKLGLLGALAYVALIGTTLVASLRVWRRHGDPIVRGAALAAFGAFVGAAVAEFTGTFTGVSLRFSFFAGVIIGWLAVADQQATTAQDQPQPAADRVAS